MKAESPLGLLSASFPTVPLGLLYLRLFQWALIKEISRGRPLNSWISVTGVMASHLSWWTIPYALESRVEFCPPPHQEIVSTDTSWEGWGIVCQGQSWSGRWQHQGQHLNWLELRTVLIALQLLQFRLRNKPVLFLIDNSTGVSYLKKQGGGARSRSLLKLTSGILKLAHDTIWIFKFYHVTSPGI